MVTVISAVHNTAPYLRAMVESVVAQTRDPFEHILVDDCSTDGSFELALQLKQEFPRLRVLQHAVNRGTPSALNTGIEEARTDFVAILDSDDIAMPHWLSTVLPIIECNTDVVSAGGGQKSSRLKVNARVFFNSVNQMAM